MSTNLTDYMVLRLFGRIRRQLNLQLTKNLKSLKIGPKQAILLRDLATVKITTSTELAKLSHTDPAATGKMLESLMNRGWVKRTDHPDDRRKWLFSLSSTGIKMVEKIEKVLHSLAGEFCRPVNKKEKAELFQRFAEISKHLETGLKDRGEQS